jgi:hypothetical protein
VLTTVTDWYRALPPRARAGLSLSDLHNLSKRLTRKHDYWRAGEPNCPGDIKAGNGELHTLRCRLCGQDSPRSQICTGAPV